MLKTEPVHRIAPAISRVVRTPADWQHCLICSPSFAFERNMCFMQRHSPPQGISIACDRARSSVMVLRLWLDLTSGTATKTYLHHMATVRRCKQVAERYKAACISEGNVMPEGRTWAASYLAQLQRGWHCTVLLKSVCNMWK